MRTRANLPARRRGLALVLLVTMAAAALAAPTPALGEDAPPCPGYQFVEGQGPSCPAPNGLWQVLLEDGGYVYAHGPDVELAFEGGPEPPSPFATHPYPPVCVADPATEPHFQLVYTRPVDVLDGYSVWAPRVRHAVNESNGLLRAEAMFFGKSMSYRVACDGDVPSVARVVLDTPSTRDTFASVVGDLRERGYNQTHVKYWILHDGEVATGVAGEATMDFDSRPGPDNANTRGPDYAVSFGSFSNATIPLVMMHESAHSMGAVPPAAPHTSGDGHCGEGVDVMCPRTALHAASFRLRMGEDCVYCNELAGIPLTARCPGSPRFDCGWDDYYDPSGQIIVGRWNLASPHNRFLDPRDRPPIMAGVACTPNPAMPNQMVTCAFLAVDESPSVTYEIHWGDGTMQHHRAEPRTSTSLTHEYRAPGVYTVTADASDRTGRSAVATAAVRVVPCILMRSDRVDVGLMSHQDVLLGRPLGEFVSHGSSRVEGDIPGACGGKAYRLDDSLLTKWSIEWRDAQGKPLPEPAHRTIPVGASSARIVLWFGFDATYNLQAAG